MAGSLKKFNSATLLENAFSTLPQVTQNDSHLIHLIQLHFQQFAPRITVLIMTKILSAGTYV